MLTSGGNGGRPVSCDVEVRSTVERQADLGVTVGALCRGQGTPQGR